jgi:glycosyltransferase involved in cell wall biosynthesis
VRTALADRAGRGAARLAAVSPAVAAHFRRWRLRGGAIDVIPNALPESSFRLQPQPARGGPLTFASLFSGGWTGLRNGAAAIEGFALARRALPDSRLLLAGNGMEAGGAAARWARDRGIAAGLDFRGMLTHKAVLAMLGEEVDILVHPALEESFGMPLLEAAAHRIPAIAGRASGAVPWLLGDGACGRLVDVRSPAAIAAAMVELGADPAGRRALGEAAWASMRTRFSLGVVADRYEAVLAEVMRG